MASPLASAVELWTAIRRRFEPHVAHFSTSSREQGQARSKCALAHRWPKSSSEDLGSTTAQLGSHETWLDLRHPARAQSRAKAHSQRAGDVEALATSGRIAVNELEDPVAEGQDRGGARGGCPLTQVQVYR